MVDTGLLGLVAVSFGFAGGAIFGMTVLSPAISKASKIGREVAISKMQIQCGEWEVVLTEKNKVLVFKDTALWRDKCMQFHNRAPAIRYFKKVSEQVLNKYYKEAALEECGKQ